MALVPLVRYLPSWMLELRHHGLLPKSSRTLSQFDLTGIQNWGNLCP